MKEKYSISGMTCSACSAHVEKAAGKLQGVQEVSVNLLTETMEISYDESLLRKEDIISAVEKAGYGAKPYEKDKQGEGRGNNPPGRYTKEGEPKKDTREMKQRLLVSIAFLLPLMYVSMFRMYNAWFGLPIPGFVEQTLAGAENAINYGLTQLLLVLPILYVNRKFFQVGFKTLFHRAPNMDSLIAIGATASVVYGVFALYRIGYGLGHGEEELVLHYSHDLYFESAGMILTLITVGKYLESRSKKKTGEAINRLMELAPDLAIVLDEEGREREIPTRDVKKGDVFIVKPGSRVPVDGVVVEGFSSVDEAAVTGESIPVEKQAGARVISATMNQTGFLKCRAERVGEDTTIAQIIRLVEEAGAGKAPIAQLADKVAGIFVPVVMGIALLTLILWLIAGAGAEFAISCAIAVLVISCPCALGLATPVAIMVGTGVGARLGILIKSGEALQLTKELDTVVLDKTGTVTAGQLQVTGIVCCETKLTERQLVALAAGLEKKSEHPLAGAILDYAEKEQIEIPEAIEFHAVFGKGIEGRMAGEKEQLLVGNRAFMEERCVELSQEVCDGSEAMAKEGWTPLFVAKFAEQGRLLGYIGVADTLKEDSEMAVRTLQKMGIHVILLTGDHRGTAEAIQKKLGMDEVIAEVLPQEKEQTIRRLRESGHKVAMVGDGINDAPALVSADVGMAIGAGTDVALESADVVLIKSSLMDVVTAVRLSRGVMRTIKQNLFWAFFYNAIGIPLAAGIWYPYFGIRLNPMFGAAAMSLSSIFVVGNALRLRKFGKIKKLEQSRKEAKKMTKIMVIEGMMCGHCTGRVQKALEAVAGVESVVMSLEEKTATVVASDSVTDELLSGVVTEAGYQVVKVENR